MFRGFALRQSFGGAASRSCLRTARRNFSHQRDHSQSFVSTLLKKRFAPALLLGVAGGFGFGLYQHWNAKNRVVGLEALPSSGGEVQLKPDTDCAEFPRTISINREVFQALGVGVRSVTFLSFHVYAAGLYIAADDVHLARGVIAKLRAKYNPSNDRDGWVRVMGDPQTGAEIIDEILKSNVRFAVRIVPTRNTDFGHLRDGFVRGITNRPEFKSLQSAEFGQSINEIKLAFGRKRKLKKGEVIVWARDLSGGMSAWYGDSDIDKEFLGSPASPDVSRLFFLQYMSGAKPNSPSLKEATVRGLVDLLT